LRMHGSLEAVYSTTGIRPTHKRTQQNIQFAVNFGWYLLWFFLISWCSWRHRHQREEQYSGLGLVLHLCAFTLLEEAGPHQESYAKKWTAKGHADLGGRYNWSVAGLYLCYPVMVWLTYRVASEVADMWRRSSFSDPEEEHHSLGGSAEPATPAGEPGLPAAEDTLVVDESHAGHGQSGHEGRGHGEPGGHGHEGHGHGHDWKMEAYHAECDSSAIVVGFLIKQFIVYIITAHPPPMALSLYFLLLPTVVWHARTGCHTRWIVRMELLLCMTLSWCVLQLSEWLTIRLVWEEASRASPFHAKTVKKILCASALSPLCLLVILQVDALADKGFIEQTSAECTIQCIAFLVGFSWEKVFASAIKNMTAWADHGLRVGGVIPALLLNTGLLIAILPAWKWFLVPVAAKPVPERKADQVSALSIVQGLFFDKPTPTKEPIKNRDQQADN